MAITKNQALNDGILGGCPLIEGREKLDLDTMIGEVVTIDDFMLVKTKKDDAYALTFKEYPQSYTWAGGFLKSCIEKYGDDFAGTKVVIGEKVRTQSNNDYRTFDIVD